jgi:hypothetical protein
MMTYFIFDEPALNTLSPDRAAHVESTSIYRVVATRTIATRTLASVLAEYLPDGQRVNFLSIDTEGSDLLVLQSNDWSRFRPEIVIAEDLNEYRLLNVGESGIVRFLDRVGYDAVAKTMNSIFFVERAGR